MINDLREFIDECEKVGELKRVKVEVDWDLELVHVADLNDEKRGPALLFEKVKDSKFPVLISALSSTKRCAIALDMPIEYRSVDMAREWMERMQRKRIPPKIVSNGPIMQNVIEETQVDLFELPVPRFYPRDGGRYIGTNASLITVDADTGWTNLGTYRMQVHDNRNIGLNILKGKHADIMLNRYRELGRIMPAAICIGYIPVLFLFSSSLIPWGVSEYDVAGGIRGESINVIKSDLTDLLIPASAEWVIEGEVNPDPTTYRAEGPFGEFTGYYTHTENYNPMPVLNVKRVLHRNNAILCAQSVGALGEGKNVIPSIQISASIWSELKAAGLPGIEAVYCLPEAGGRFLCVVSIKQKYPGHASQVGHAVAASNTGCYRTKICIVVDDDISPDDTSKVLWALATRSNATRSVHVLNRTRANVADPALPIETKEIGSKLIIDATIPFEWKTKPIMVQLDSKMIQKVKAGWKRYCID